MKNKRVKKTLIYHLPVKWIELNVTGSWLTHHMIQIHGSFIHSLFSLLGKMKNQMIFNQMSFDKKNIKESLFFFANIWINIWAVFLLLTPPPPPTAVNIIIIIIPGWWWWNTYHTLCILNFCTSGDAFFDFWFSVFILNPAKKKKKKKNTGWPFN